MGGKLSFPKDTLPSERTFLVTGANSGIGYYTAKKIAQYGGHVVITCRTEEKAKKTIEKMKEEHAKELGAMKGKETTMAQELNMQFMTVELGSLKSVMEFVEKYKSSGLPLHVLICNAGMVVDKKNYTNDGYEYHFQINYLSHFLMTLYLLPILKASGPNSRVVNVSSVGHSWFGKFDIENMQAEKNFSTWTSYGTSKLLQVMNMYSLAPRVEKDGVQVFSIHPGLVMTNFNNNSDTAFKRGMGNFMIATGVFRNSEKGAFTTLAAALDGKYNGKTGLYFASSKPTPSSNLSRDKTKQDQLWRYSLECIKEYLTDDILKEVGESLSDIKDVKHSIASGQTAEATPTNVTATDGAAAASNVAPVAETTKDETSSQ